MTFQDRLCGNLALRRTNLATDEERKAISYVTGEIKLELTVPNGFDVEPTVEINGNKAYTCSVEEQPPKIWKYLAVVEINTDPMIKVQLGNVTVQKQVHARGGQTTTQNFVFSSSQ